MGFSLPECTQVFHELEHILPGGWIQKIHQPFSHTLTLDIRIPGETLTLLISVDSGTSRFHVTQHQYPHPSTPLPFCQFLRSHLQGGKIVSLAQEPNDRIIYFHIIKSHKPYTLVIALIGRNANVFLLDAQGKILRTQKASHRQIGDIFTPPEKKSSVIPTSMSENVLHLDQQTVLPERSLSNQDDKFFTKYPTSSMIARRFQQIEEQRNFDSRHRHYLGQLRKQLKQAKAKLKGLQEDVSKVEQYREYGRYGELLKGVIPELQKGQQTISLTDYYDPALPTLTIPLDPEKSPTKNMEAYFRKYQKFLGAQQHLLPRIDNQKTLILKLEHEVQAMEKGEIDITGNIQPTPTPASSMKIKSSKGKSSPSRGYRTYISSDGKPILVGKTAKDNDYLTFKVGKPDDLWLHARGQPGSHVLVRLDKGETVPHETLKDAATLTLWFSDLRKSGKGEVIHTLRKFVKKAKGQKPGAVHVTREKTFWVEVKQDRLNRLKGDTP